MNNARTNAVVRRQLDRLKESHPGMLILFGKGDWHEAFFEDADAIGKAVKRKVVTRWEGESGMPMIGFPASDLADALTRLLKRKHRVALIDERNRKEL